MPNPYSHSIVHIISIASLKFCRLWGYVAPSGPPVRMDIEGLRNLKPETFFSCRKSLNPILLVRSWMMIEPINQWVALCSIRTFCVGSSVNRRRWDPLVSFRLTYPFLSYGVSNHGIYRGCLWVKVIGMFCLLWRGCVRLSWSPSYGLFYGFVGFLVPKYACVSWNPMELNVPSWFPEWLRHREGSFDQILPW